MVKKKELTTERRIEKDLIGIFLFLGFLIALYFITSAIFQSFNEFEYRGLSFTKERFDQLEVYRHYYFFEDPESRELFRYNLYLKIDPRENTVPFEGDEIQFKYGKTAYIGMDTSEIKHCSEGTIAVATLSGFLSDNQIPVISGTNDFVETALFPDFPYITCEKYRYNSVISIIRGEETKIVSEGNCYTITIGPECNMVEAVEKFMVESIVHSRS